MGVCQFGMIYTINNNAGMFLWFNIDQLVLEKIQCCDFNIENYDLQHYERMLC